jgi:hypothetical protein
VHVGRLHRDEERLRDLLVAQLLRGQLRDSALARRQRFEPGQEDLARPRAGRHELFIGTLDQRSRAATVGQLDAPAEQLAGLGPLVHAPQRSAELDQGKSAECDPDPSGDAPTARVLELLDNQLPRLVVLSPPPLKPDPSARVEEKGEGVVRTVRHMLADQSLRSPTLFFINPRVVASEVTFTRSPRRRAAATSSSKSAMARGSPVKARTSGA